MKVCCCILNVLLSITKTAHYIVITNQMIDVGRYLFSKAHILHTYNFFHVYLNFQNHLFTKKKKE